MIPFVAGHVSGYHDAETDQWRKAFLNCAEAGATIITATETGKAEAVRGRPPYWGIARISDKWGSDECSIIWHTDFWRPASEPYAVRVSWTDFYDLDGDPQPHHPVYVVVAPLSHKLFPNLVVIPFAAHLPSDVDGLTGFNPSAWRRVKAWHESIDGLPAAMELALSRHPGAARLGGLDLNVDLAHAWVRERLAMELPAFRLGWDGHYPGTRGRRTIDAHLVGERLELRKPSHVVGDAPGIDHNQFVTPMQAVSITPPR